MTGYPIPYVTTSTPAGEKTMDIYSRLLDERIVYPGTPVDDGVANAVIAQLLHLESESADAPASGGGRSADQVREDTERQLVLTPEAAVAYGIVDRALTRRA